MEKSRFFNVILLSLSAGTAGENAGGHPPMADAPYREIQKSLGLFRSSFLLFPHLPLKPPNCRAGGQSPWFRVRDC